MAKALDRRIFLVGAGVLAVVAVLRLLFLIFVDDPGELSHGRQTRYHLKTRISFQAEGATGELLRVHLPEVPLNLDSPFEDGHFDQEVNLKLSEEPRKFICQVIRGGRVVAQSDPRALGPNNDLGKVELRILR